MGKTRAAQRRPAIVLSAVAVLALVAAALALTATAASDNAYTVTNLVSDQTGVAAQTDTHHGDPA